MKKIKIITDSASDINRDLCEKYDISVLPLSISFGDEEYLDYVNLSADQFVELLKTKKVLPKTSMVSASHVQEAIEKYAKEYDEVLYITISKEISGTYDGAKKAMEDMKNKHGWDNVTIYNSTTFSIGQAMLVKIASEMAAIGESVSKIIDKLNQIRKKQRVVFVLQDLSYVRAGGRISATEAIIGGILDIKPIFEINQEGKPSVISKARGLNRTIEKITQMIAKEVKGKLDEVWLLHCDAQDIMQRLEKLVTEQFEPARVFICKAGGCIGTHGGPGLFGIAYLIS